ncbi:MAG: DUF975 family protein [Treponema sp.]|nr:DUF975 family protein [Treponema sp.]
MFDRPKYKRFAKVQLQGRWTVPVLMTLIITIISTIFSIPEMTQMYNSGVIDMYLHGNFAEAQNTLAGIQSSPKDLYITIIQAIVSQILSVAALNVYLRMTRSPDKVSFSKFIEGFNNWGRATLGILWQLLWVFLWTFLFVIPGIIKSIAYSQMFYLIAEYDNLSVTKAMRISQIITKGHKWDLFVMGLSFLGWVLLGIITLGISDLFVSPYMNLSFVNAYHALLKEAVDTGRINPEDLSE